MSKLEKLIENNRKWSEGILKKNPNFFKKLSKQQAPEYLWIGCSDSRVPASEIVNLMPGELFVHRNVANIVIHTDLNCLSVLQYAVEILKVKHIIVCGHYNCGGVKAAMTNVSLGLIDNWLCHIQNIEKNYKKYLNSIENEILRLNKLCELNVIEQVLNTARSTILQNAWLKHQEISLHGWIYGISNGRIRDLGISISNKKQLKEVYENTVRELR